MNLLLKNFINNVWKDRVKIINEQKKDWNWRKELGIDDTSDKPKKEKPKKILKKNVEKEDWNWRKDLGIDDSDDTNKNSTEKFKDGLTNHQRDYQEKKQEYNPDGTAKDPWWAIPLGIIVIILIASAIFEAVSTVGSSVKNFLREIVIKNKFVLTKHVILKMNLLLKNFINNAWKDSMNNSLAGIVGGILGIVVWKVSPYSADFGVGPLIFIIICIVGGIVTFGNKSIWNQKI